MVILAEDYDGDGDIDAKDMKNHLKEFDVGNTVLRDDSGRGDSRPPDNKLSFSR